MLNRRSILKRRMPNDLSSRNIVTLLNLLLEQLNLSCYSVLKRLNKQNGEVKKQRSGERH